MKTTQNNLDCAEVTCLENEIKARKNTIAINILEIGDRLIKAKEILNHGEFTKFLEERVMFSDRTARQYMKASSAFPEEKRKSISGLKSTQILFLAELPEDKRESFESKYDIEKISKMSTRELKELIRLERHNDNIASHFAETVEEGYQEFEIEIDELKPSPDYDIYINDTLGVRTGTDYIKFLNAVNEHPNWFDPIKITKDNYIIDGHERVRAYRDLGIKTIKARYAVLFDSCKLETLDRCMSAVFLEYQRWEYTRTSAFYYLSAMFYSMIGDKKQAETDLFILKTLGEEIDKRHSEDVKAGRCYLEMCKKMGGEKADKEKVLSETIKELERLGIGNSVRLFI